VSERDEGDVGARAVRRARVAGWEARLAGVPGASPPVLLVHGLGESSRCFAGVLERLARAGAFAVAPDLPGYGLTAPERGENGRGDEGGGLAGVADGLAVLLRDLGAGPAVVVGHSLGGVVATFLAERAAALVAGVVDVDGNVSEGDCTYSGRAARWSEDAFVERGFAALRGDVERAGAGDPALAGYAASLRLADARTYHRHALELVALSRGEGLARRLAALPVAAVYVAGVPGGASARSLDLLERAGVSVRRVGPAGHWPFVDQPAAFDAELEAFRAATRG
jgi:pimeloyl-ACP methyl ester carboxylesterase